MEKARRLLSLLKEWWAGPILGTPPNIKRGPKFYKNGNKTGKIGSTSPKIGKYAVLDEIFRSSKNDGVRIYSKGASRIKGVQNFTKTVIILAKMEGPS